MAIPPPMPTALPAPALSASAKLPKIVPLRDVGILWDVLDENTTSIGRRLIVGNRRLVDVHQDTVVEDTATITEVLVEPDRSTSPMPMLPETVLLFRLNVVAYGVLSRNRIPAPLKVAELSAIVVLLTLTVSRFAESQGRTNHPRYHWRSCRWCRSCWWSAQRPDASRLPHCIWNIELITYRQVSERTSCVYLWLTSSKLTRYIQSPWTFWAALGMMNEALLGHRSPEFPPRACLLNLPLPWANLKKI